MAIMNRNYKLSFFKNITYLSSGLLLTNNNQWEEPTSQHSKRDIDLETTTTLQTHNTNKQQRWWEKRG